MNERQRLFAELMGYLERYDKTAACSIITAYMTDRQLYKMVETERDTRKASK